MIKLKNVGFGFVSEKEILHNISLNLEPGKIYGLMGLNGIGKTTFLKLLMGLNFQDKGTISVMGYEPKNRPVELLDKMIYVSDFIYLPRVELSVLPSKIGDYYSCFDKDKFFKYLSELNISKTKNLNELSLGQAKAVSICFGLAANPNVLLLDEPTNALDIPTKSVIKKMISSWMNDDKICIIATHQVHDVQQLFDSVLLHIDKETLLKLDNDEILEKVHFGIGASIDINDGILYETRGVGGYAYVGTGARVDSLDIDYDLLFKATMANPKITKNLFKKDVYENSTTNN